MKSSRVGAEPNPIRIFDGFSLQANPISIDGVSPWGSIVLKPCLAGDSYLCYPDSVACAVKVIEIDSGECVNTIVGHMDAVTCCCFRQELCEL